MAKKGFQSDRAILEFRKSGSLISWSKDVIHVGNSTSSVRPMPHFLCVVSILVHVKKIFKSTEELSIDAIETFLQINWCKGKH